MSNRERGRANASILIPAEDRWNPLEHVSAPEYVPSLWDGPHCGVRLVQAFKTLSAIPVAKGPSSRSGYWPRHPMEWIEIVAKEHEWLNDYGQASEAAHNGRGRATVARRKKSAAWKRLCPGQHAICVTARWFAG